MQDCTKLNSFAPTPVTLARTEAEQSLVERLRGGDEAAFLTLVDRYQQDLLHLALSYVNNKTLAEEVVQETWVGVLRSIQRFEARASLKTWLFRILTNLAKTKVKREARLIFLADWEEDEADCDNAVALLHQPLHSWSSYQQTNGYTSQGRTVGWSGSPEEVLLTQELRALIEQIVATLPSLQRSVITLRDMMGCSAAETCDELGVSEVNQRVLLHRARSKVRQSLANYFDHGTCLLYL